MASIISLRSRLFQRLLRVGVLCSLFLITISGAVVAQKSESDRDTLLIEKLKSGGYNLYVRHAATDWSQSDNISAYGDWISCDPRKVRQLSEEGRRDARALGEAFRSLGIRLGQVFASPYCRTMETAQLISGREVVSTVDLMNLRSEAFVGGRDAIVMRARKRLAARPATDVNDMFVAHGNLGRAATGQALGEGEVLVIAPLGNGQFDIIGTLTSTRLKPLIER